MEQQYNSQRRRYTLGHGVYSGNITLDNGRSIWLEYKQEVIWSVSGLRRLQDALEYIAAKFCEERPYYNHVQIQYVHFLETLKILASG
jgi:hypothetical protein